MENTEEYFDVSAKWALCYPKQWRHSHCVHWFPWNASFFFQRENLSQYIDKFFIVQYPDWSLLWFQQIEVHLQIKVVKHHCDLYYWWIPPSTCKRLLYSDSQLIIEAVSLLVLELSLWLCCWCCCWWWWCCCCYCQCQLYHQSHAIHHYFQCTGQHNGSSL